MTVQKDDLIKIASDMETMLALSGKKEKSAEAKNWKTPYHREFL